MAEITLEAERRNEHGSAPAGRLRLEGKIPAVIYGKGVGPISISVNHHIVCKTFAKAESRTQTIALMLDGVSHSVKIQEIQRHAVKGTASHIDFITV